MKNLLIITMLLGVGYTQQGIIKSIENVLQGRGYCDGVYVDDCSGDGDCCPVSWIGDGFADCEDQAYGCDLTCYDNDGNDCAGYGGCNESTWQEYYDSPDHNMQGCNLSGANLAGANLSQAFLYVADLSGANLQEANLQWANLYGADLSGANLSDAVLSYANLEGANLSWAVLTWADLYGANLTGANLQGADIFFSNFHEANLCNLAGSSDGECEQSEGITDDDADGYDDVSYEVGYEAGAESGDSNLDGVVNIFDIMITVGIALGN